MSLCVSTRFVMTETLGNTCVVGAVELPQHVPLDREGEMQVGGLGRCGKAMVAVGLASCAFLMMIQCGSSRFDDDLARVPF